MIKECKTCGHPFIAKYNKEEYGSLLCRKLSYLRYDKDRYYKFKEKRKNQAREYYYGQKSIGKVCRFCGYVIKSNSFNLCYRKADRMRKRFWEHSYHFKVNRARWTVSKEGRQSIRKSSKKYKKSERGKLSEWKYRRTSKRKAVLKRYNQSNKGKNANRIKSMRYYEKKVLIEGRARIPIEIGYLVFDLFDNKCVNCNSNNKLVIDHFYPLKKGNSIIRNGKLNGDLLCNSCNLKKGILNPEDFFDEDKFNYIKGLLDSVELNKVPFGMKVRMTE